MLMQLIHSRSDTLQNRGNVAVDYFPFRFEEHYYISLQFEALAFVKFLSILLAPVLHTINVHIMIDRIFL